MFICDNNNVYVIKNGFQKSPRRFSHTHQCASAHNHCCSSQELNFKVAMATIPPPLPKTAVHWLRGGCVGAAGVALHCNVIGKFYFERVQGAMMYCARESFDPCYYINELGFMI